MQKSKIEWCDATWNPVTGCYHQCEYCYARRIAQRFGGYDVRSIGGPDATARGEAMDKAKIVEYRWDIEPLDKAVKFLKDGKTAPYPYGFRPTFHKDRLSEPRKMGRPRTIFVCSMADLFGDWVPDKWIQAVFDACERASQHTYLFLTKNPKRYLKLAEQGKLPEEKNMWYGTTVPTPDTSYFYNSSCRIFISVEPMQEEFGDCLGDSWTIPDGVIIGAETGNRKGKIVPKKEWIENLAAECGRYGIPVFMKDSLIPIVGEENMRRELPWRI